MSEASTVTTANIAGEINTVSESSIVVEVTQSTEPSAYLKTYEPQLSYDTPVEQIAVELAQKTECVQQETVNANTNAENKPVEFPLRIYELGINHIVWLSECSGVELGICHSWVKQRADQPDFLWQFHVAHYNRDKNWPGLAAFETYVADRYDRRNKCVRYQQLKNPIDLLSSKDKLADMLKMGLLLFGTSQA